MLDMTLSVMGMYNEDSEILDATHFILPEDIDRDSLITMILTETAELEVVYPDPNAFKIIIRAWSYARCPSWERVLDALEEEYNPIHNYDRTEVETGAETGTGSETETENSEDTFNEDTTETVSEDTTDSVSEDMTDSGSLSKTETVTGQVTGFNSSSFADDNKSTTGTSSSDSLTRDRDQTTTVDRDITTTTDRNESREGERTTERHKTSGANKQRNLHVFGNIGVLTTQAMLTQELELRKLDVYRLITEEFSNYFCIQVY